MTGIKITDEKIKEKKVGKLKPIEKFSKKDESGNLRIYWKCICDCGNTHNVLRYHLIKSNILSCGCSRSGKGPSLKNILTKEFLKLEYVKNQKGVTDISKEFNINRGSITQYLIKFQIPIRGRKDTVRRHWKGSGEIYYTYFSSIKRRAKYDNINFNLSIEFLWELFMKQNRFCALSGIEIYFCVKGSGYNKNSKNRAVQTASLDRKDSNQGYTEDNVQWVHKVVNTMKMKLSDKDFIEWCQLIINNKNSEV